MLASRTAYLIGSQESTSLGINEIAQHQNPTCDATKYHQTKEFWGSRSIVDKKSCNSTRNHKSEGIGSELCLVAKHRRGY